MNRSHDHDTDVDALLSQLRLEPVADEGFTDRVMAALPARRRQDAGRPLMIAAIGIGTVLTLGSMAEADLLERSVLEWQSGSLGLASALLLSTLLTLAAGLGGWAISEGDA